MIAARQISTGVGAFGWLCSALAGNLALSDSARAYSDPESYELSVEEGGGGGRWFTGTPLDGYGCDVCHRATGALEISVTGLPETGYAAGQAYELGVQWPAEVEHMAAVIELVDDTGKTAGTLLTPREDATRPEERCTRKGLDTPGTLIVDSPTGRQFATAIDCGSRAMRMLWTAPQAPAGRLWLSGGLVAADDDATADGDVALLIRKAVVPQGQVAPEMQLTVAHGCAVSPGDHGGSLGTACVVAALLMLHARSRRRGGERR